jgi:hypothetical protein
MYKKGFMVDAKGYGSNTPEDGRSPTKNKLWLSRVPSQTDKSPSIIATGG